MGGPRWARHTRATALGDTQGRFHESLRTNPGNVACLVFLPLWLQFLSWRSGRPHLAGPALPAPAVPGVSELLFKVGYDSTVLRPRAAWPLRLLQALLGQLGQVLLWWEDRDKGGRERVSGDLAGEERKGCAPPNILPIR